MKQLLLSVCLLAGINISIHATDPAFGWDAPAPRARSAPPTFIPLDHLTEDVRPRRFTEADIDLPTLREMVKPTAASKSAIGWWFTFSSMLHGSRPNAIRRNFSRFWRAFGRMREPERVVCVVRLFNAQSMHHLYDREAWMEMPLPMGRVRPKRGPSQGKPKTVGSRSLVDKRDSEIRNAHRKVGSPRNVIVKALAMTANREKRRAVGGLDMSRERG